MFVEGNVGHDVVADDGVVIGYASSRGGGDRPITLGPEARLRSGTVLYAGTRIGARFETGHHVVVREESVIGDDVSVWSSSVIDYGCLIGDRVKIHSNCYVAQFTEIGDDAFLGPGVIIANDLYPGRSDSAEHMSGPLIEAGAQIGANVTILPFVTIGSEAIVGAGAVVARDVPPRMVAYGSPAVPVHGVDELQVITERIERVGNGRLRLRQRSGS